MPRNDYTTDQLFDSDALIKEVTSSKPMQSRQDEFLLTPGELGWDQNNQYFHDSEQQQRFFACALATLQDPHKQNCRRRLLGFLSVISKCIDEEGLLPFFVEHNRSALRFHQQPFLRALAGWVLEPRSKTECERLLYCLEETPEGLEHCALHCDDLEDGLIASVHSLGELQFGRERAIPKHFFSILSAVLYVATEEKKTAKVAKRVKAAIKEQGLESLDSSWPRDISDVSCVSIDDGIAQMATWIDAFPINPDVYAILASLMALYPHQVILRVEQHQSICLHALTNLKMINEVLQPEQRYYSNEDLLIMLAHIARFYDAVLNDLNHSNLIKLVSPPVELLRGAGFGEVDRYQKQLVLICGVFIDVIPEILAGSNTQSGTGGYEAKAKACINTFERLGSTLHTALDLPFDEDFYHGRILDLSQEKRDMANSAIKSAFACFVGLAEWQRCAAPLCPGTSGEELKKCSACLRVLYCSSECMAAAWKAKYAPHKELCRVTRHLAEETAISAKPTTDGLLRFYQTVDGNASLEQDSVEMKRCYDRLKAALSGTIGPR